MRKQLAGTTHTCLHLINDQKDAMLVTEVAQPLQDVRRDITNSTLTLDGFNHYGGSLRPHQGAGCFDIDTCGMIETWHFRAKTFEMLRVTGGGYGCQCPAVKRPFKCYNPVPLWISFGKMIAARDFDCAFARFST